MVSVFREPYGDQVRRYSAATRLIEIRVGPQAKGIEAYLQQLCGTLASSIHVDGVAIALVPAYASDNVVVASNGLSRLVTEFQIESGEGPGCDAVSTARPVLTPRMSEAVGRWPTYAPLALSLSIAAVFAFPIRVGAVRFGALVVYSQQSRVLSRAQTMTALTFALIAAETLLESVHKHVDNRMVSEQRIPESPATSSAIWQAQGMTMVDLQVSASAALAQMRAYAIEHNIELSDVADVVIGGVTLKQMTSR